MSKKKGRQAAIQTLRKALSLNISGLTFEEKNVIEDVISELNEPTDADLMDAFLERNKKHKRFTFRGTEFVFDEGQIVEVVKTEWGTFFEFVSYGLLFEVIKNQKEIAWEKNKQPKKMLTDEQVKILQGLYLLGFRFVAKDEIDWIYAYKVKPIKKDTMWDAAPNVTGEIPTWTYDQLKDLVSWDDEEPCDIRKVLKEAGIEVEK